MLRPRLEPYTDIGVKRLKCLRCGEQANAQWSICADNSATGKTQYRPLCVECDIALNKLVLSWAGFRDARAMGQAYEKKARAAQ